MEEKIKELKDKLEKEIKQVKEEFKEKVITLVLGGFGLVAALAWNEAIKTFFETIFPKTSALIGKFVYAIIVTFIVVILSLQLKKILEKK